MLIIRNFNDKFYCFTKVTSFTVIVVLFYLAVLLNFLVLLIYCLEREVYQSCLQSAVLMIVTWYLNDNKVAIFRRRKRTMLKALVLFLLWCGMKLMNKKKLQWIDDNVCFDCINGSDSKENVLWWFRHVLKALWWEERGRNGAQRAHG